MVFTEVEGRGLGDTHITGRHFEGDTHITSDIWRGYTYHGDTYTYHCDSAGQQPGSDN